MQILVVVELIQMKTLKAEVEKGFMTTSIGYELLGPNVMGKSYMNLFRYRKGIRLIFLKQFYLAATHKKFETSVHTLRRVIFSF